MLIESNHKVCDELLRMRMCGHVQVLRLLRVLGSGSASASDAMSDVLAQVTAYQSASRR